MWGASGLEDLLEIVGLEVTAEGVRTGTHSEGLRERIPDCRSCNTESMGAKQSANMWDDKIESYYVFFTW